MKKLVLVLVSAMLMTLFIAFNYLLWDKEQNTQNIKDLEYKNDDKDATINALGREIKNLEDANRDLTSKSKALESSSSDMKKKYDELVQEQLKTKEILGRKCDIIDVFKQQIDIKSLEAIIKKWADSIDKGQYEAAYKLELQHFKDNGEVISLSEYGEGYKNSIKSIKVKGIKLWNGQPQDNDSEDLAFIVTLDVKKIEGGNDNSFVDGPNEKLFSIVYNEEKGGWIISGISSPQIQ